MTARLGCLLLSLVAGCSSLIVSPSVARPAALTSAAAARHPSPVAQQELVGNLEKLSAEDKAAIDEREANDALMQAAGGDSDFVRWYRYEKAKEKFMKENPQNPLENVFNKVKGPLSSILILGAGFYAIPLIRGIADGVRDGDVIGELSQSLANPTDSVKGIIP